MSNRPLLCLLAVSGVLSITDVHAVPAQSDPKGAANAAGQPSRERRPVPIRADAPEGALTAELPEPGQPDGKVVLSPLSADATAALLRRLEPLPDLSSGNAKAPVLRAPSAPPPRAGATQPISFAIPAGKSVPKGTIAPALPQKVEKALVAPHISPQGEISRESEVRIRFGEAMVPVAEVGLAKQPPATITPNVPGTWRWLDSRVLLFTTSKRFPGSTEFVVRVPAGTKALGGAKLAEDVSVRFQTAPVRMSGRFPSRSILPTSPFLVTFDQEIDLDRILPFLQVENTRGKRLPWKRVSMAAAEQVWKEKPTGDTEAAVIIAPTTAWPAGTTIAAVLKKGAPSREGPRTTTTSSSITTDVVAPFKVLGVSCDYGTTPRLNGTVCPADGSLWVEFSNPIDPKSYRSSKVQIAGEAFEDQSPNGTSVYLSTPQAVGRQYAVAIGDGIQDTYGQPLTGSRRVSFTTGPQRYQAYVSAPEGLQVLDPRFEIPQWVVHAESVRSLRIQLYQVEPKDYFAYQEFQDKKHPTPPGRRVFDRQTVVGAKHRADVRVDLRPALNKGGVGHVIAVATSSPLHGRNADDELNGVAWIQVTKLGISARIDKEKLNGWVQGISPDKLSAPIGGATVSLLAKHRDTKTTATSDAEGHAAFELPLPEKSEDGLRDKQALLVAEAQGDSTFIEVSSFERAIRRENALWYVTDDRFLYKPGETIYLKGWLRWTHNGVNPNLALPATGEEVAYALHDARGVKIASGNSKTSETGGFDLEVKLPPNVNLGYASFQLVSRKSRHTHPISIQEFRAPAYAVTLNDDVTHAGTAPVVLGESIEMSASAKYYAGGGLTGAQIRWKATLTPTSYTPPGWSLFSFDPSHPEDGTIEIEKPDVLDATSSARVSWGISALRGGHPSVLNVDATITDLDRMSILASSRPILVHPSAIYVGVRSKIAPEGGEVLELVVTDADGKPVADVPVDVKIDGVLYSDRHHPDAKVVDAQTCKRTSATVPVACPFKPIDRNTVYTATATVMDKRGRRNTTVYQLPWYAMADHQSDFELLPDKRSYRVGDTARIEIYSTVLPATAIVSFARQGVIAQKRVELTKPSTFVELPIEPGYLENVFVVVDRYAARDTRDDKKKRPPLPDHETREVQLIISTESARLITTVRPTHALVEPGEEATFDVTVERDGKPVANAEVALMAVDEAILALAGQSHADPLTAFYRRMVAGTRHSTSIDILRDAGDDLDGEPGIRRYRLDKLLGHRRAHAAACAAGEGTIGLGNFGTIGRGGSGVVKARKDFRANAAFSPRLKTDAHGRASLTVKMPDSLSRFRIVALASSGTYFFGKAENVIVTQRKLNARTIAPRFLSQGDKFSLPVLVQNLDVRPRTVDVAVRAANLVAVGPAGKRVTIPGGQRAEVRFDFGSQARGRAVVQTLATSGDFADASNVEFPVYEPATTEAFATYGTVDDGAKFEQLQVPRDLFQDVGGVEVTLASTELQSLTDAYWYLHAYPYECAEQRSSRMLATSAVYDILDAFATPGRPSRKEIEDTRNSDVRALTKDQLPDGGWGYFPGMKSDPFVTMQVVQALAASHQATPALGRATVYVRAQWNTIISELQRAASATHARRPDPSRLSYLVSLASSTLGPLVASGEDALPRAETLHKLALRLAVYPMDAKARLLSLVANVERTKAMRAGLLAQIVSATHETAAAATVTTSYSDGERLLLVSNHKTNALVLDALLRESPEHPLVTKLARGVLAGRRYGRWGSTQENLVVLQALRRYFDTFEKETPNYTGKLWVGQAAYAEQAFVGRSNLRGQVSLDWSSLVPGSTHDLALAKDGAGRMYYRVGVTYAPKTTQMSALDAGFVVRRTYSAVDAPSDVSKLGDGRWKIRLGAKVLVTLETLNTSLRSNVALVDPLPAGFETVNEALATSERAVHAEGEERWDYTNLRDNRSEVFSLSLPEGSHRFSYTVRATTPGTFIAAPAKAEEMYSPETFGRSAGEIVEIAEP
jgi:uncharacterized protein YfaS (alpha-2-macroglobulin family)